MNISCSTISPECVVGTTVNIYAILTSSGKTLYPIDKYLIEEIYINSIDNWQTLLQEAFQSAIVNYPTTKYTIGVQIVDGCGQYGNFVISNKIKDAEAIVLTATPSSTVPKYDWSAEVSLNTGFLSGDVLTIDLTGIPSTFTLNSISSITPATSAISVVGQTLVFSGNVSAGTYFVISGTFDDNLCTAGNVTLTISGDTITTNNVVTGTYSGATWCVPPVLKDTLVDTDNNANGYGCNAGVLVYPFTIDLTARGGSIVAVTNDADIIAAYAALPIPIAVTISGCDIVLPTGETPTDIEIKKAQ